MVSIAVDRENSIRLARKVLAKKPVYLDTETTGADAAAEVIEISIIDHDERILVDSLVRPCTAIAREATQVHGITDDMVLFAPGWPEIWPAIEAALSGRWVGIYNADFDLRLIKQSHLLAGLDWRPIGAKAICIMKLYAQFYGDWNDWHSSYRWQSLEKAGQQCGIELPDAHRATADTILTMSVLHHMADSPTTGEQA